MFKKKGVILIIRYSVCATLIILSKFTCKEGKRHQNVLLKTSEKSLKVGAKTAFRRRFSFLFYRKTSFHTTRLHPFGRIATPFGVDGYTLWGKWCSLLSNTILHVTSRFLPWETANYCISVFFITLSLLFQKSFLSLCRVCFSGFPLNASREMPAPFLYPL